MQDNMMAVSIIQRSICVVSVLFCAVSVASVHDDAAPAIAGRAAPNFVAKILPLGASIVWGYNTVDGNGSVLLFYLNTTVESV